MTWGFVEFYSDSKARPASTLAIFFCSANPDGDE